MLRLLRLVLIYFTACGYTLQGSGSVLPPSIKTVYVADVENNTTESGLGLVLTEALKDTFERYGTLRVVEQETLADAILTTKILNLDRQTRSVTSATDTALQLETVINVASDLRTPTGLVLWSNPRLSVSQHFGTDQDVVVTSSPAFASSGLSSSDLSGLSTREIARGQEQQVLEGMSETLAKRIYQAAVLPAF